MPEGGAFIPLRELGELDASDTSLARLRSEQDVLLRDMAQNHDGGRSRTRAVRDRSPEEHHRLELRYEAVCRDIHRLEGSSRDQAAQRIADWARSRPIAAQEVMRLLPPGAIVRTIQPIGDIESNTLALAVYYADDGHTIGIVPMPMGAAAGLARSRSRRSSTSRNGTYRWSLPTTSRSYPDSRLPPKPASPNSSQTKPQRESARPRCGKACDAGPAPWCLRTSARARRPRT